MPAGPMIIDVVYDTICPWCFIGKRRLEQALALRPNFPAILRWHPFLLNPQMPPEGADRSVYLTKKFGGEARVKRIFGAISEAGKGVGVDFAFDRIARTPNTVNAHRLVHRAQIEDRAGDAVEAVFKAYFLDGRDTGSVEILVDIGEDLGLDPVELRRYLMGNEDVTAIYENNARAHRTGINGVPSFLFNGRLAISGAQEPPVLARILDVAQVVDAELPFADGKDSMSRP